LRRERPSARWTTHWPRPPLLAPPPLLAGQSILVRGERRGEESREREVEGDGQGREVVAVLAAVRKGVSR